MTNEGMCKFRRKSGVLILPDIFYKLIVVCFSQNALIANSIICFKLVAM